MSIKSRVEKLERAQPPAKAAAPSVVIVLPRKDDGSSPPAGDYLSADGRVITRYEDRPPWDFVRGCYKDAAE